MMEKTINVNELRELLKCDEIKFIHVATFSKQHNPEKKRVGIGGVLTIHYE